MIINTSFSVSPADQPQSRNPRGGAAPAVESATDKPQPVNPGQFVLKAPQSAQDFEQARQYQQFIREDNNAQSRTAIASYTALEKARQRENIREMFGVDLYA
ncbi:hypothetical protein OCL06_15425 [Alteromonas sp. ASW11-19]|uniref:Uncharacterized protein n=1 Tax=Alteromonas salexigens TaxID=2982530 RepID=A0ABT2VRN9_9ALTE|nr:hypothetical protein [Alteromonas salexigens]MCU7555980.1 hypothetical protein [Alteromonas salexigens]